MAILKKGSAGATSFIHHQEAKPDYRGKAEMAKAGIFIGYQ
jgi:hypothetical protein